LYDTISSSRYFYGTVIFDMATETISTSLATASFDKLDGGWYRLKMTATSPNPLLGSTGVQISLTQAGSIFIWGAQMEAGGYATSYIKNVDDINGVTRLKDECFNGGDADLFDITEGTFFVDSYVYNSGNFTIITLCDGSASNRLALIFQNYGTQVRVLSSGGVDSYLNLNFDQRNKIAVTFKENEYKFFINGALVGSDTSATVPSGMDRLNFSNNTNVSNHFEGKVYDTRVYDRVLTEAEAITLTTI